MGKEGDAGREELEEVVNMLFETEESCLYISRRLYQFFVYPDVSDGVMENVVKQMAKVMRENDFSIIEPLKLLLKSEHFFDQEQFNTLIKSPLDFTFGIYKELDIDKDQYDLIAGFAVGKKASKNQLPNELAQQEQLSSRKHLDEILFENNFKENYSNKR